MTDTIDWDKAVDVFFAQETANECNLRALILRQHEELRDMREYQEHDGNPFRCALGRDYCHENVERLAEMVRERVRDRKGT